MELNFSKSTPTVPIRDIDNKPSSSSNQIRQIKLHDNDSEPPSASMTPRNKFLDIEDAPVTFPRHHADVGGPLLHHPSTDSVPVYRGSYAHTSHTSLKSYAQALTGTSTPIDGPSHGNLHPSRSGVVVGQIHTPTVSFNASQLNSGFATPRSSAFVEPKMKYLQRKLEKLFGNRVTEERETYGIEELRNGFFDAIFIPPTMVQRATMGEKVCSIEGEVTATASKGFGNKLQYEFSKVLRISWKGIIKFFHNIGARQQGTRLLKAFLAYFITYILCLIVPINHWFGRFNFFAPFAVLFHHPGRASGSQIEICLLSIAGTAIGLGWGSFGLYIVSSTPKATELFGLINSISLVICLAITSWFKAAFVRLHHFLTSLVLAVFFLEVVDVGDSSVSWIKAWQFGMPYLFGILIALVVNILIFPDFGHQNVMSVVKSSLAECLEATGHLFTNDEKTDTARRLTKISLELSEAVREFSNEVSISTIRRTELIEMRNTIQVGIARIRAVPPPSTLYISETKDSDIQTDAASIIRHSLSQSSNELIRTISQTLQICIDYVSYLYDGSNTAENYNKDHSTILRDQLAKTELAIAKVSHAYATTLRADSHTLTQSPNQELFDILLHIYYLAEAGKSVLSIGKEFYKTSINRRSWKISLPNYPIMRALRRNSSQIIHDLGGKTATYYYWAKKDVDEIFDQIYSINTSRVNKVPDEVPSLSMRNASGKTIRYKIWSVFHRLQGEETRYALKITLSIVIISIPAWVGSSHAWYSQRDFWLSGIIALMIIHARVGGNAHDFVVRSALCFAGSIWGAIAIRARYSNPYVVAVFCAIFMIPCLYRFIGTHHARSGLIGCMSFTLVSLSLYGEGYIPHDRLFDTIWPRVVACEVGVLTALVVNWILWPFVARHEVRKSMSTLLSHIGKIYHLVSDRYIYRDKGDEPTVLALQLSEICENRVHRSILALSELLQMIHHEPSLRGTFDEAPYYSMLESCESILQNLIAARINSTHFNVYEFDPQGQISQRLKALRRDSVASLLFDLYILSGSFRSKLKVPRYLPSSAMARKVLFDYMAQVQIQEEQENDYFGSYAFSADQGHSSALAGTPRTNPTPHYGSDEKLMWAVVHETAFSKSFTRTAEELEKLIGYSKRILGEQSI